MKEHYMFKRMAKVENTDDAKHREEGANETQVRGWWSRKPLETTLEYWLAVSMRAEHMHSL